MKNSTLQTCKEGVAEQELRMGVRIRKYSRVRAKISYHLSHEFGVSRAEIARQLGVCTSAIAKVGGTSYIAPVKRENEKILSFIKTASYKTLLILGTLFPLNPITDLP